MKKRPVIKTLGTEMQHFGTHKNDPTNYNKIAKLGLIYTIILYTIFIAKIILTK
jgi:hypothetical protein